MIRNSADAICIFIIIMSFALIIRLLCIVLDELLGNNEKGDTDIRRNVLGAL